MGTDRIVLVLALSCPLLVVSCAQPAADGGGGGEAAALALPDGPAAIGASPMGAGSRQIAVVVGLADPPVALVAGANARREGAKIASAGQRAHRETLRQKHEDLAQRVRALGGRDLARMSVALNAVIVSIDASKLGEIAALPGVVSVRPVRDYQVDLAETVPYVGAAALQQGGIDGTGVRVAVLDSGADYTHLNLGGSGVVADFTGNDATIVEPGTFPTGKVIGGTDFVGSRWPCVPAPSPGNCNPDPPAPLEPDADPLDKCPDPDPDPAKFLPCSSGHGTHVSDILAGETVVGGSRTHVGVAPGAKLYAVKVCSSTTTACSGVALLQGIEFALDPDGDGDVDDAVDVINMSLGSSYGQREDDLGAASANAVRLGVLVVASAGNAADRPFIVGSPSSTPEVISVAQTQVPSAKLYRIVAGAVTVGGSWQQWSAAPTLVSGPLHYDTTSVATRRGCVDAAGASPWVGTPFTGRIVLVDRGVCAVSMKVSNVAAAGGIAAIVANNVSQGPGDLPPDFSFGGGNPAVAGYTITLADGNALKTVLGAATTIDPASAASLVKNMVASSSRGPSYSFAAIKPDIGAPGASVSAQFGTGNGTTAFGGTSGSAPMVSGAAALLVQAFPERSPFELKSLLMNTGETDIGINPVALAGVGAPISRIGGGELRVDRAFASRTAAWDADARTGSLSFGYHAVDERTELEKRVAVRNYSSRFRTYTITPLFRYADDAASGAVRISAPAQVRVPPRGTRTFPVRLEIDPAKLPVWDLNGGSRGGDGFRLQGVELDGYLRIRNQDDDVHVAWHVLPHRSAAIEAEEMIALRSDGTATLELENEEASLDGRVEVFSLTGTSPPLPPPTSAIDGSNIAIVDLAAVGVRPAVVSGIPAVQFAVDTLGRRAHPAYPAELDVFLDVNRDGNADFVVFNRENGAFASTGQTIVAVFSFATGRATAFFFADADLESGNIILTAPLSALGLTPDTRFDFQVLAFDNYFTGALTDSTDVMTHTLGTPRFTGSPATLTVPAGDEASIAVQAVPGGEAASPSQQGLLLLYRDQSESRESDAVLVEPSRRVATAVLGTRAAIGR